VFSSFVKNKENKKSKLRRFRDIPTGNRKIWAKLTYFLEEIRTLTKIFKIP
jgi:hypothetical protein